MTDTTATSAINITIRLFIFTPPYADFKSTFTPFASAPHKFTFAPGLPRLLVLTAILR
jgi:hypothetical protein